MKTGQLASAAGSGGSVVVDCCQVCGDKALQDVIFLGYLPPVNKLHVIGAVPHEQPAYPAQLLMCPTCHLAQLGLIVDPAILFPKEYPYTSSTTKILRDNFAELAEECASLLTLNADDLVVDIGSNDGNLLSNFKNTCQVQGITPEDIGELAREKGIPTLTAYFDDAAVEQVLRERGPAKIVTATNVFAHIEHVHDVVDGVIALMADDGVFISESGYFVDLIETLQYDTIYHEHLRYYSLHSLVYLLEKHGLEVFHAKRIPTHGGSIRVYAARKGTQTVQPSVAELLTMEKNSVLKPEVLADFKDKVVQTKLGLHTMLADIKKQGQRVFGIGAPSRGSTLINYVGLDDGLLDCVLEITGSYKIGKYIPGTIIPILDEQKMYEDQPEYVLFLSWHIGDELAPKLKQRGYTGDFIIPLPEPRILKNADV